MSELITTGIWTVKPGEHGAFEQAWTDFATWASTQPGATTLRLGHNTADAERYVSFAPWTDPDSVRAWKSQPGFQQRMGQVRRHVVAFEPLELDVVASIASPASVG